MSILIEINDLHLESANVNDNLYHCLKAHMRCDHSALLKESRERRRECQCVELYVRVCVFRTEKDTERDSVCV